MSDLMDALTELRQARPCYEEAWAYYSGETRERFASPLMEKLLGTSRSFNVNLACRPVDAVLDRLQVSAVTSTPEDPAVAAMWEANQLDLEAPQIHKAALVYGDAYVFVWESETAEDSEETAEQDPGPGVDIFYNSPLVARVLYEEENPRRKRLAIKSWCEGTGDDQRVRVNLYYPDRIEKYISREKTKGEKDEEFIPFVDDSTDENGVMDNPYGRIPFFHFRTAAPYGIPVHKNAYGPQDALNKLITNQMTASDFTAFPQRWGLLETGATSDDDIDWGDDETVDPEDKESSLVSKPGSLWALRNYKAVGEFAASDVKNFLEPMGVYVRFMAAVTSTPLRWFDPSGDVPSGSSIRADEAPLNKKVTSFGLSFGGTWADAGEFGLKILGRPAAQVTVRWENPQTVEDLEFWQMVSEKQAAGVPVRQSLLEAGYSETECDEWGYTEEEPNGPGGFSEAPELAARTQEPVAVGAE